MKRFYQNLLLQNDLNRDQCGEFLFLKGMMFREREKWWESGGTRPAPHEGIDILYYADESGNVRSFNPGTRIPAAGNGIVAAVINDLLGKTIFLRHEVYRGDRGLYSAYAHIQPREKIGQGMTVRAGEVIAEINPLEEGKIAISPHLHLTLAWIPHRLFPGKISWDIMGTGEGIALLDPLEYLGLPYRIIEDIHSPVNTQSDSSH